METLTHAELDTLLPMLEAAIPPETARRLVEQAKLFLKYFEGFSQEEA